MSTEGAPKDGSTIPQEKEEPPAKNATSSLGKKDGASETESERCVEVVEAKQSFDKNVAKNGNGAPEQKGQAKSAHPSGQASAENKAKDTPAMRASVGASTDVENNNEVAGSSTKLVTDLKPNVTFEDKTINAKDEPSKEAALALKDVEKSEKVAKCSRELFPDPKADITSVDSTRKAKDVPSQKATSAPKKVAPAGTPKAGDAKAVLPAEKKTTGDEQKGVSSPEKANKSDQKPPSVSDIKNVARVEASSTDQTMKDSDNEKSSSRTKRSAAKSAESVAWKRKKVAAKSVLLASAGKSSASDWQASPASVWGKSSMDVANRKKNLDKKNSSVGGSPKSQVKKEATKETKKKSDKEEKKEAQKNNKLSGAKAPKRLMAPEVWSGKPEEPLPGGWPDGWTKKVFERPSGKTKGTRDRYWYSPVTKRKFRSMVEVNSFMAALLQSKGDEDAAWNIFKKVKSSVQG